MPRRGAPWPPPSPRRRAEGPSRRGNPLAQHPLARPQPPAQHTPAPPQDPAGSSTEGEKPYAPLAAPRARLAPLQPQLTSPHPPLPRGAHTQPAWCGVTPSSHPPGTSRGDNKAPVGKRCGSRGFRGGVTREVAGGFTRWWPPLLPGLMSLWAGSNPCPCLQHPARLQTPGWGGPVPPGTCARGTATTHGSACSEGHKQTPLAAPAALLVGPSWHSAPCSHQCVPTNSPQEAQKAF